MMMQVIYWLEDFTLLPCDLTYQYELNKHFEPNYMI